MDTKEKHKSNILPAFFMGILFVLIYILAILITQPFIDSGMTPAFENPDDPMNIIFIVVIMLVFTLIILLIAKYYKKQLIQVIILGAIGYTAAYVIYPLITLILPLTIDFSVYIAAIISIAFAILLVLILYKYPEWYIIDLSGILIGTGAIAIFGMSLGILLIIILLIGLSIYDAISVYKTKHMIDLADTVMDLKLPVLLVIPKVWRYSLIKETKRLKEQLEKDEERDAFFLGLGDIVIPGILVLAAYNSTELNPYSLPIAITIIAGILVGFAILMTFVIKGKPQAGLPCLCGGAIAGYVISTLILFGELKGLTLPFY